MLIRLYISETLESCFSVHPHNHRKVNNIFNMALIIFMFSFASFKLDFVDSSGIHSTALVCMYFCDYRIEAVKAHFET